MSGTEKFQLRLLGGFSVRRDGSESEIHLGSKERALLAYLVLHPNRRETRQKLATLLWGNIAEESARQSLNECLSKLRKAHDDQERKIFANQGDHIAVDSAPFEIDARDFIESARKTDLDSLEKAEALYAGELLDGLEVRTEGFEEWLRDERAQLREFANGAAIRLMELREAAGDADRAAGAAHRLLRADPCCEEAHRLLMRRHWATRHWKSAFEQYQACEAALKESLNIPPSPETRQLHEDIRRAYQQDVSSQVKPPPGNEQPSIPLPPVPTKHNRHQRPKPQSIRRLIRKLVATIVALVVVLVLSISYLVWSHWRIPELAPSWLGEFILAIKGPVTTPPPSIVVLPFKGSGDDTARANAYADALAEGISSALAKASEMFVVAQSSAEVYQGRTETVSKITQELGVRYALEGSLQKWGDRVTIQVALIDTDKGEHRKFTESFEGTAADFYALQRSITLEVITSLQVEITEGEKERINLAHGTSNLDAWLSAAEAYKLLRHLTPDDNRRARQLYQHAIELDPSYAGAQEGLAWTHFIDAKFRWGPSPEQSIAEAARLASIVLSLDPTRPRVYSLLGSIQLINRNYDAAVEFGEKAVTMEPNDADARFLLGYTLTFSGEPQRAIALIKKAIDLTPYPPGLYLVVLGRANRLAGSYHQAAAILEAVVAVDSSSYIPFVELAATYIELGSSEKAKAAAKKVVDISPDFKSSLWVQSPAFEDAATTAREIEILRAAGLPD